MTAFNVNSLNSSQIKDRIHSFMSTWNATGMFQMLEETMVNNEMSIVKLYTMHEAI